MPYFENCQQVSSPILPDFRILQLQFQLRFLVPGLSVLLLCLSSILCLPPWLLHNLIIQSDTSLLWIPDFPIFKSLKTLFSLSRNSKISFDFLDRAFGHEWMRVPQSRAEKRNPFYVKVDGRKMGENRIWTWNWRGKNCRLRTAVEGEGIPACLWAGRHRQCQETARWEGQEPLQHQLPRSAREVEIWEFIKIKKWRSISFWKKIITILVRNMKISFIMILTGEFFTFFQISDYFFGLLKSYAYPSHYLLNSLSSWHFYVHIRIGFSWEYNLNLQLAQFALLGYSLSYDYRYSISSLQFHSRAPLLEANY